VREQIDGAEPLSRLHLIQEEANLEAELARMGVAQDMAALEKAFIEVAKGYAERKGIGYDAWRSAGVPADVLHQAGITRSE
jgi:hypothetical protein